MAQAVSIYRLSDPRVPHETRYVGKTACALRERLGRHLMEARRGLKAHRYHWIRGLLSAGVVPSIELIEACTESNWKEREQHWIAKLRGEGHPLTNTGNGGDGLDSSAWREVWRRPGQREKQAEALRAYNADPAVRDRKRRQGLARWAGKPRSRQKLTPEAYAAVQKATWARHPERRQAYGSASRARWANPETRARITAAMRAVITPEYRAQRSAASKRRWEKHRTNQGSTSCT